MTQILDPSVGEQARSALARHAWSEAYDLLREADARQQLAPDELELLSEASWWTGHLPEAIEARERAFASYVRDGATGRAASAAIELGRDNLLRNAQSVASAWLRRAERLLDGLPETAGHGWLAATRAFQAGLEGDFVRAAELSDAAAAVADRVGDQDLGTQAMSTKGMSLIYQGQVEEGLALIDDAAVAAVAGGIDPLTAGAVSCTTISACTSLGDWVRALQWTEAQDRWCKREQINGFPGMCRLHRAETKRLRGAWLEAEAEARRASDELAGFIPAAIGVALYEIGVIRLRRGDLPAAEEALLRAHTYGRDPEPALSLLRLAQGRVDEAKASIRRALDEPEPKTAWGAPPGSDLNRLSLLPAQVEIAVTDGDLSTARGAVDEMARLAARFPSAASEAAVACVDGLVLLAEGAPGDAARRARRAIQLWTELDAPWETARARMVLARAYAATGDAPGATLEAQSARAAFESLGAELDRQAADELLGSQGTAPAGRESGRVAAETREALRTFVFTDIVDSTRLGELLGDEAWNRLLRWHDETLRGLVAAHGGTEIKTIGDGFFLAFDAPGMAIDCAIAIQRRLEEQRQTQGFAPAVRIGIHRGKARRRGLDYIGQGVNQAARIGAAAAGGEILVSAETLAAARHAFVEGDRRTMHLKGISRPVEVATVTW